MQTPLYKCTWEDNNRMKVKELPIFDEFIRVHGDTPVSEAAARMVDEGVMDVIAVDDRDSVLGVVTLFTLLEKVLAKGLDSSKITCKEVVSTNYTTITKDSDVATGITKYMATQVSEGSDIPGLIVIDGDKLVGLLSIGDMLAAVTSRRQYKFSMI
ncbi:MAG: CBS domain-containing protein [Methanomicrobia archaeon]|nr:CBS domain-containing protein [Methanomicrobia archaeon]